MSPKTRAQYQKRFCIRAVTAVPMPTANDAIKTGNKCQQDFQSF